MTLRASKEILRLAELEKASWHKPSQRPRNDDKGAPEISATVLLYNEQDKIHALGWFNFDTDKWTAFEDHMFDVNEPFVWCYLPKP